MIHIVDKNFETDDGNILHNQSVKDFYIGQTAVTQELWKAVMGNNDRKIGELEYKSSDCGWRSVFGEHTKKLIGDEKPMVGITYEDCLEFIKKLNDITGKYFRLPTDREWLFAANGTIIENDRKPTDIQESAWFAENSKLELHNVSQKAPNQFGLYDMYGNVSWTVKSNVEEVMPLMIIMVLGLSFNVTMMMKIVAMTILDFDSY